MEGIDNCPIKFAKCCSPLPGDDIIGFVTRGFGVSIHKRDCANVQQSMKDPENAARWVKSYWADDAKEDYKATLELDCMDRANLLSDVALALGDMRVPIYSLSARAADQGRARMSLTVGIMNTVHLNNVVARLKKSQRCSDSYPQLKLLYRGLFDPFLILFCKKRTEKTLIYQT